MDMLRSRVERRRRVVPPPRRAGPPVSPPETLSTNSEGGPERIDLKTTGERESALIKQAGGSTMKTGERVQSTPGTDLPEVHQPTVPGAKEEIVTDIFTTRTPDRFVQLGVRVRDIFDERLDEIVHQLRRSGVRSSKAELVELLLFELPSQPDDLLRTRLAAFRREAPRAGS